MKVINNNLLLGLIILLLTFTTNQLIIYGSGNINVESRQINFKTDSLFKKSHDFYYNEWVLPAPFLFNQPNGNLLFTNSVYSNINITQNQFPQNEPAVAISRKDPNRVVACWRDFRTGVNPAIRRVGYSHSVDGGYTWSTSTLLPIIDTTHPWASDPAACTDTSGYFYISTLTLNTARTDGYVLVYKSTDGGITFNITYNIAPHPDTLLFMEDKDYIASDLSATSPYRNNIYAVWSGMSRYGGVLVRSTNSGLTWSERISLPFGGLGLVPTVGPNGALYVIGNGIDTLNSQYGIYITRSTDGGLHFGSTILIDSLPNGGYVIRLSSIAVDISGGARNGNVYAAWSCPFDYNSHNEDEDIFFSRSSDGGITWSPRKRVNNDALYNGKKQYFPWMTCNENGNIFIVFYDTRNTANNQIIEAYIAKSSDGGISFTNEILSTQQSPVIYPNWEVRFGDYIGIDSWGGKIIPVWTDERAGGFDMEIYCSVISDTVIGIKPISENIPVKYNLYQNYPNPFNPVTQIKFDISKEGNVRLTIYDILGRKLKELINEKLTAGTYNIEWDASEFSSGIYFYSLIIDASASLNTGFSETKKMVLVK